MAIRAVLSVCYFHLRASFIVCLQLQLRYLITLLVIICVLVFVSVVLFVELFVLFICLVFLGCAQLHYRGNIYSFL